MELIENTALKRKEEINNARWKHEEIYREFPSIHQIDATFSKTICA